MLDGRDPAHYLKALVSDNVPKRLLWLACAAESERDMGSWVERWSHGALGSTHWTSRRGERTDTLAPYNSPSGLWVNADRFCLPRRRTVLFAYDLAWQLRVSQALIQLPMLDWHVDKIVLERTAAWALFRDGDRTLLMCDLKSWCPVPLDTLRKDCHASGFVYDRDGETTGLPEYYCLRDASYVREATLQILDWINVEELGPFRPTGSGQSYSAFRRRFLADKLLVHDDIPRLHAERVAMWTGRCEAWQHGKLTDGPYVEYDLHAAYATIARDCHVPTVMRGEWDNPPWGDVIAAMGRAACLAHITVTTDVPCLPTKLAGRTIWPIGTFSTWVWDPELTLAYEHCREVTVHKLYTYHRGPALADFAGFVLQSMADKDTPYGKVPIRVMKHWSRCLVGRLGLRYRSWQKFGTQDEPDLRLVTFIDTDEGTSTDMLIAGYDRLILADMSESVDSLPQVPSWVMSECRRRLWGAMTFAGFDRVVYIDTDSVVLCANGGLRVGTMDYMREHGWVVKGKGYKSMIIHGPRNIVAESTRRVAGLPLTARQVAPLEFSGQVMRSIKESMRAGELDCVASIPRKFVMDSPDMRRQHLQDNKTAPFEVSLSERTDDYE